MQKMRRYHDSLRALVTKAERAREFVNRRSRQVELT